MKLNIVLALLQISTLSIVTSQQDSFKFLNREWYATGYGDKDLNIGDIIPFDTNKIEIKNNNNFMMWEFNKDGYFNDLNVRVKSNFGDNTGDSVVAMSDDDIKWQLNKQTSDIIIDYGNIEGYGNFKAKYKIIELSKSKLLLKKLNAMQCPKSKEIRK